MYVSWIIKKIEYLSLSKNQLHAKSEKNSDKPLEHVYLCARIGRFKGQEISEWKYWVVPLPKICTKKLEKILPWILIAEFFKNSIVLRAGILNFKFKIVFWNIFFSRFGDLKNESHFLEKSHL